MSFLDEEVPAWRQREAELGQCRGPGCNTLAPVLWARTSWYHPKFQCKGLRVEKEGVSEGRLFQNGGSFWQRRDQCLSGTRHRFTGQGCVVLPVPQTRRSQLNGTLQPKPNHA